ncbi:hypothetical protein K9N68_18240 [Kovacikia minuta CCNUW1]|uniref:hypothetical protein n=1 Tax=Kovacikia minuta TaxID=2931930 RepID=UPI001CCEA153|nr:hypothetical protein [Kovacikia minuta]UBF23710.1 hypothetical protein K9N68_18240 [Kovacikia minuta CCNUW1]
MNNGQVNIASIRCQFSNLTAFALTRPETMETIFAGNEPLGLQVQVEFGSGGAIALMPLALPIRVDFFAEAYGKGDAIDLGNVVAKTKPQQYIYPLTLEISRGPFGVGLSAEKLYNVSAVLRIGTSEGPSFITGFLENLAIQIYDP